MGELLDKRGEWTFDGYPWYGVEHKKMSKFVEMWFT